MDPIADGAEIARTLMSEVSPLRFLAAIAGMAASGVGIAALGVPAVARRILRPPIETFLADNLPFSDMLHGDRFMRCQDGTLVATIRIAGRPSGALGRDERMKLFQQRRLWIDMLAGSKAEVRAFSLRRRRRLDARVPAREEDGPMLARIVNGWHASFEDTFETEHTVAVSVAGGAEKGRSRLEELVEQSLLLLSGFGARPLMHRAVPMQGGGAASELLSWWARLINPANPAPVSARIRRDLADHLYGGPVEFDHANGLITWSAGSEQVFGHMVVVQRWGEESAEEIVGRLLSIPGELTVIHNFHVLFGPDAEFRIKRKGDLALSTKQSASIAEQIAQAQEALTAGAARAQSLVQYEFVVLTHGRTPEEAREVADEVRRVLIDYQMRPVIERHLTQVLWFTQWPSYDRRVRETDLLSGNLAELATFEAWPQGDDRSDWGPGPILMLRTEAGTPFSFQFHASPEKEALGHCLVIGKSGSGKTTAMTLLASGALARHPDLKVFAFDRFKGCLVWTFALGAIARYVALQTDVPGIETASLQPLQLELNVENRAHIHTLLRMLVGLTDPESERMYADAVAMLPNLERQDRRLETIASAFDRRSDAALQLEKWIDQKQYGPVFDPPENRVHLKGARVVVFDMDRSLDDEVLAPPLVTDLFHRIRAELAASGSPGLIIIDEAEPMLRNPLFRQEFLRLLLEGRKRRYVVVVMMQRPDGLDSIDPKFAEAVRQNCPTHILFPNEAATKKDYKGYDAYQLTDRERIGLAGGLPHLIHMDRPLLLKRPEQGTSQWLDISMRGLGPMAQAFRSGEQFWREAARYSALARQRGMTHEMALEEFLGWAERVSGRTAKEAA